MSFCLAWASSCRRRPCLGRSGPAATSPAGSATAPAPPQSVHHWPRDNARAPVPSPSSSLRRGGGGSSHAASPAAAARQLLPLALCKGPGRSEEPGRSTAAARSPEGFPASLGLGTGRLQPAASSPPGARHGAVEAVRPVADPLQGAAAQPPSDLAHGSGVRPGADPPRWGPALPAAQQPAQPLHQPEGNQPQAPDVPGKGASLRKGCCCPRLASPINQLLNFFVQMRRCAK